MGIVYNIGLSLILTYLVGLSLTHMNPPKARPTTPADEVAMRNKIHREAVRRSRTQRRIKARPRHLLCYIGPIPVCVVPALVWVVTESEQKLQHSFNGARRKLRVQSAGGFPAGVLCVPADLHAPLHVVAHRFARVVNAAALPPLLKCGPGPFLALL